MLFNVRVERFNGVAHVCLRGEMDMAAVGIFMDEIALLEADGVNLLVDLSELSFVDSSGLHALLEVHERGLTRNRVVELVRCPPRLSRVFELTNIAYLITE